MRPMSKELFAATLEGVDWSSSVEIAERLDEAGYWDEEFEELALERAKKQHVRQKIKTLKDDFGNPLFASVEEKDLAGKAEHGYKQEALFEEADYEKVIGYYASRIRIYSNRVKGYQKRARDRYGADIPLPFRIDDPQVNLNSWVE